MGSNYPPAAVRASEKEINVARHEGVPSGRDFVENNLAPPVGNSSIRHTTNTVWVRGESIFEGAASEVHGGILWRDSITCLAGLPIVSVAPGTSCAGSRRITYAADQFHSTQ